MSDPAYKEPTATVAPLRVVLFGATGTIGQATLQALLTAGHDVVAVVRRSLPEAIAHPRLHTVVATLDEPLSLASAMDGADAVISCIASRSGEPQDAWAVDHDLNVTALDAAQRSNVNHFVLLSAICVQKPKLAFQRAKLAFEAKLTASGVQYSIVRPTAYFKSLSGQADRLRQGKPFLVFGDGTLTACKPISDADLARFLVATLSNPACANRILPVGGPGPARTPAEQGRQLADAVGVPFQMRRIPIAVFDVIITLLSVAGWISQRARAKADLARIGRYYATESMLIWDASANRYDPDLTPEFGEDRLEHFFEQLARGEAMVERGEHAVF